VCSAGCLRRLCFSHEQWPDVLSGHSSLLWTHTRSTHRLYAAAFCLSHTMSLSVCTSETCLAGSGVASAVRPVLPILDALYATRATLEGLVAKHGARAARCARSSAPQCRCCMARPAAAYTASSVHPSARLLPRAQHGSWLRAQCAHWHSPGLQNAWRVSECHCRLPGFSKEVKKSGSGARAGGRQRCWRSCARGTRRSRRASRGASARSARTATRSVRAARLLNAAPETSMLFGPLSAGGQRLLDRWKVCASGSVAGARLMRPWVASRASFSTVQRQSLCRADITHACHACCARQSVPVTAASAVYRPLHTYWERVLSILAMRAAGPRSRELLTATGDDAASAEQVCTIQLFLHARAAKRCCSLQMLAGNPKTKRKSHCNAQAVAAARSNACERCCHSMPSRMCAASVQTPKRSR